MSYGYGEWRLYISYESAEHWSGKKLWPEYFHVRLPQSGDSQGTWYLHTANTVLTLSSCRNHTTFSNWHWYMHLNWTLYNGAPTILHVMIRGLLLHWTLFIYLCNQGLPQPEGDIANDELRWFSINFFQIWLVIQAGIRDWQLQSSNQSSI